MKMNQLRFFLLFAALLALMACSSPAKKAATHKAKKVSPVHDTKVEKAGKGLDKKTEGIRGKDDKDDDKGRGRY